MENEAEPKQLQEQPQMIGGAVSIEIDPASGQLKMSTPPNNMVALAIIEAGKAFLLMQMQDGMRRAAAARPPAIVPAGADALANLRRLS